MAQRLKQIKMFISYSHLDMKYKNNFMNHLKTLERYYNIIAWHDGCINAGQNIDDEIKEKLNEANVILLLISPNFMKSDYCWEIELTKAIDKALRNECIVIPVILMRTIIKEDHYFSKLSRVPKDGKPICSFKPHNDGYIQCIEIISKQFDNYLKINKQSSVPIDTNLYLNLIKNGEYYHFQLSQDLMNGIPRFVKNITLFSSRITEALVNSLNSYKIFYDVYKDKKGKTIKSKFINERATNFRLFLMEICLYIKELIIGSANVRIHFRYYKDEKYLGFIAAESGREDVALDWSTKLTPMPAHESMIFFSFKHEFPLIKSMNLKYHKKAKNDKKWIEYATFVFKNYIVANYPLLSMGISLKKENVSSHRKYLVLLCLFRFDDIINNLISTYESAFRETDKNFSISDIINSI